MNGRTWTPERFGACIPCWLCRGGILLALLVSAPTGARPLLLDDKTSSSAGFVIELNAAEADVLQAVKSVAQDPIVRGTYVYQREQILRGAMPAESSAFFGRWQEPGHVFYKVLAGAVAPRHFKDSADIGTITVRYVVQAVAAARTRLRIDAVFVENSTRRAHSSDGTVESSEFKEIQDRLRQMQLNAQQAAELKQHQEEENTAKANLLRQREDEAAKLVTAQSSVRTLEQRVHDLRHDVELRVKDQNTELKSAPFHSAAKLQVLSAGTEVVVLIITPYWYGVETKDGQRGWLRDNQVEPLP